MCIHMINSNKHPKTSQRYGESLNNHIAQFANPSTFEEPKNVPRTLDLLHDGQQAVT